MKQKQYQYGDCIPESIKMYNELLKKGLEPEIVEGWVEVDYSDLLPEQECLERYFPDIWAEVDTDKLFNDYPRVMPHTWLILNDKVIDVTKNQFDDLGGIIKYFEQSRQRLKNNKKMTRIDFDLESPDAIITYDLWVYYPEENKERVVI